jgi:hypothetical protein
MTMTGKAEDLGKRQRRARTRFAPSRRWAVQGIEGASGLCLSGQERFEAIKAMAAARAEENAKLMG